MSGSFGDLPHATGDRAWVGDEGIAAASRSIAGAIVADGATVESISKRVSGWVAQHPQQVAGHDLAWTAAQAVNAGLLALNGGLAVCLTALLGYQLYSLRQKLKAGVFGSKLTLRLVLLFTLVAVLPGVLVYGVSVQFVARSIESWFDVRVE